ncbi:MAG: DUF3048 domain-containing protein [Clostridia bacterium]|nr:DUF3048 domain-containing protein [Clostridia bacterium]
MKGKRKSNKKLVVACIVALLVVLGVGMGAFALTGCSGGDEETAVEPEVIINPITGEEMPDGLPARPVQVSIPNAPDGAVPQSNISYADIIYEIPAEGQITRLQAIFYSQFPDKVGPVRSVRYYFVDLAQEYKSYYVGYGWGRLARGYMNGAGIPHINGMQDTALFTRVSDKAAPNNAYIDWSNIEARDGYNDQQTIKAWKFRDDEWKAEVKEAKALIEEKGDSDDPEDIEAVEKAKAFVNHDKATSISVQGKDPRNNRSACSYDEEKGVYTRTWFGDPYVDKETGEQLEFQNILVQKVYSEPLLDSNGMADHKGRLKLKLNGSGEAYLFTNGEVIKGTWSKKKAGSRTIFKDESGKQFRFTKGKTWVYVVDGNMDFSYE